MAEVETLHPDDETGLRNNVTDLLEAARKSDLRAVVIAFRRGDRSYRVYWNGDELECIGLCSIADGDIHQSIGVARQQSYGQLPIKDDGDEDK